ncbi:amino acid permease [Neobacillus fumarioli]|uniref:amino acid permease n=1 Tax=Neobacillus fumarioli TaxID=105229 RepID=UPI0008378B17|nr:amino acid permease [Neobacillus fumarioli]
MVIGVLLLIVTLMAMIGIFTKANQGIKKARAKGITGDDLNSFGYKQELLRDLGGFSNFAVSFSCISILTGGVTLYGVGFTNGGPAIIGIGWVLVILFCLFVSAALAELTSAIPTSGGVYHWASILGNRTTGWFSAALNTVGQVATLAGIDFGLAGFASALIWPNPTPTQVNLLCAGILLSHALLNHFGIHLVAKLNDISAIYHMVGVAVIVGALALFAPSHHPISYLFDTTFSTQANSLHIPYGVAFLFGLLQAQWTITGYDASAHISEETLDPRIRAPWGVYMSVVISGIFGFLLLGMVTISITNQAEVAAAPNAFLTAVQQALGTKFGSFLSWGVSVAMWFCGLAATTSSSRMIYAFSRDNGLPLSKIWGKVSTRFHTPAAAIYLAVLIALLLGLQPGIYAAVTAISVMGLHTSYLIPISYKLRAISRGAWTTEDNGPWYLGKWSVPINIIALVWIVFFDILFVVAPNDVTFGSYTMHYTTGKAFLFIMALIVILYYTFAKRVYKGPHLGTYAEVNIRLNQKEPQSKAEEEIV